MAARISGQRIDLGAIRRWIEEQIAPIVVVETAGGLFSPLGPGLTNADLANALRPSAVLLVGADRLGALHDVTAALGLASARGIASHGTVLCASQQPDSSTGSNAGELARLGIARPIATFPRASAEDPASLAAAECLLAALL
jgi:dethiobiotin synthetase